MNRIRTAFVGAAAALAVALPLAGCAEVGISEQDAYAVGCPAVDTAVASGSVANKATLAGLRALRDSGRLDADGQRWVEATITLLERPDRAPAEVKRLIIEGCAAHGHPLTNLK